MPPGMIPAPMMSATHLPAASTSAKPTISARAVSGFCRIRTVISVMTPSTHSDPAKALEPGDDPHQVVARGLRRLAADLEDFARDQHDLAAEHVIGGHAVFQAMHAAGIFRDIAADRTQALRRVVRAAN